VTSVAGAAAQIESGLPVAVPTDTVYGLAADPRRADAVERLFELKGRPDELALPVLVAGAGAALELAEPGPARDQLQLLAGRFWPGPLTLVVPLATGAGLVLGGDGRTVGLRCPGHPLLRQLLEVTGPLAVTSANRHGEPPCTSAAQVRNVFGASLAAVLDGGTCEGAPSSVVSLLAAEPTVLRRGPVDLAELLEALADRPARRARTASGRRPARG